MLQFDLNSKNADSKKNPWQKGHLSTRTKKIFVLCASCLAAAFFMTVVVRAWTLRKAVPAPLSGAEKTTLNALLDARYPQRTDILAQLPYKVIPAELDVGAKSAIAIDAANGNILYEKNADEVIPPASMTKLIVLYVVFQEIATGRIHLDDVVPLPPEAWACNMPPHSSLMFLGKNQIVTLEELMLGSAICSGNDAAYAIAGYVAGSMDAFIARMNAEVSALGLTHTHFEEASGYSEKNTTTAREMAAFTKVYLERYPESLHKFHSKLSLTYPQEHNLPWEDRALPKAQDFSHGLPERITMPIYQKNTNPLLGALEGCDGLKTGYIEESGYNLALTARQNGTRFISITMGGLGNNTKEGQKGRVHDGTEIMEWAFRTFADYKNPLLLREYSIPLVFARAQRINLVPAYKPEALCVPIVAARNKEEPLSDVRINLVLPAVLKGTMSAGDEHGAIEYYLGENLLQRIPLVAERSEKRASPWLCAADLFAQLSLKL